MSTEQELQAPLAAHAMGTDVERVDAPAKVTGQARYAVEHPAERPAYAHLVQAPVARGRLTELDTAAAATADGVVAVIDHTNAPRLADRSDLEYDVLQDEEIRFRGQVVAVVVADSVEQARAAAELVRVGFTEQPADVEFTVEAATIRPETVNGGFPCDTAVGDVDRGLAESARVLEEQYVSPEEHNSPMEPHASQVRWDSGAERLEVIASTQHPQGLQDTLATTLGLAPEQIRVRAPYVGGGFGSKGEPHAPEILAGITALAVPDRTVRLAVTRQQMFSLTGYRGTITSRLRLGSVEDGTLRAIEHEAFEESSNVKQYPEQTAVTTRMLYAAPDRRTSHRLADLDVPVPSWMRAPGVWPGVYALEVAMDELADRLGIDPIQLRIDNEPTVDPESGKPFGDRRLVECLRLGAERFGWADRPGTGERVEGDWRIGYGVATSTYPGEAAPDNAASVTAGKHGRHTVSIAAVDIGTGSRTALKLVAADALGIDPDLVDIELGDSSMPLATVAGGSSGLTSWGNAVTSAARTFRDEHGDDPAEGATSTAKAVPMPDMEDYSHHSFGAQFVELGVHRLTGEPRVRRMLGIFSVGQVVNPRGARSQLLGGMIMGMSVGLLEESFRDPRFGSVVTQDLASYHVAACADVPPIEVDWLDVDASAPIDQMRSRGAGEIGIVGTAAAIVNAAYNATGVRVRSLPATADRFL